MTLTPHQRDAILGDEPHTLRLAGAVLHTARRAAQAADYAEAARLLAQPDPDHAGFARFVVDHRLDTEQALRLAVSLLAGRLQAVVVKCEAVAAVSDPVVLHDALAEVRRMAGGAA